LDDVGWCLLAIVILAGGSLFFSVNAVALRIFSRVKLQEAFRASNGTDLTDDLTDNAERLTLTCVFCRMLSNVCILGLLFWLLAGRHKDGADGFDYVFALVIGTGIFLIFGLAIPNAWAKYSGEKILTRTYRILCVFSRVLSPVLFIIRLYDGLVRRLAGVARSNPLAEQEVKQEEFLSVVEQGKMEGVVDEEEQEMIENVLELSETTAEEIMTPRTDIVAVSAGAGLPEILDVVSNAGHSRIPVYEDNIDNIIGLIYAKDLLTEIGRDPQQFDIRRKLRQAYFVPETKPLRVLLHEFQNQKLHIAIVLDEYGGTGGIVTIEDILEELVGEIVDEYEETPEQSVKKIDKRTIEVDARIYVDDLNKEFELELPEDEDYDTIGGFVFSHLGYIPKMGQEFVYRNLKFVISAAEARRVKRVRIQKLTDEEAGR